MDSRYKVLVVAFYLAKFDKEATENLKCSTFTEVKNLVGEKLNINPNTIKNRRDDFDPLFSHRKGWYQRELSPTHLDVVKNFDSLSEPALRKIVEDILYATSSDNLDILNEIVELNANDEQQEDTVLSTRGVTGKAAEEYFLRTYHPEHFPGEELIDTRDLGTGYDFAIKDSKKVYEVKGLKGSYGGIQFTDKEWGKALELKENYVVVLVRNVMEESHKSTNLYTDPANRFNAEQRLTTVVSASWNVKPSELGEKGE